MAGKGGSSKFQTTLTEAVVRDLCARRAFDQGDTWQRSGHVHNALFVDDTLQAEVLGTWQRVDNVTIQMSGGRLQTVCTCRIGPFCRHAVAVLLQWVRKPSVFQLPARPTTDGTPLSGYSGASTTSATTPSEETLLEEYSRLLATHTLPELREVAKRRGVTAGAQRKADFLEQLIPLIATTASLDAAIAELPGDAQLVLVLIDLMREAGVPATLVSMFPIFRAYGGDAERDTVRLEIVETLIGLGLLHHPGHAYDSYTGLMTVPRLVASRLPRLAQLVTSVKAKAVEDGSDTNGPDRRGAIRLPLAELMQIIALEIRQGTVGRRRPQLRLDDVRPAPQGWRIEAREPVVTTSRWNAVNNWRLAPLPGILVPSDRKHLAQRTGHSVEAIDFAIKLMVHLRIVNPGRGSHVRSNSGQSGFGYARSGPPSPPSDTGSQEAVSVREDVLREVFARPPEERLAQMVATWLAQMDPTTELRLLIGPERPLELYIREGARSTSGPRGVEARKLIARIIGHLSGLDSREPQNAASATENGASAPWYDLDSLLDLIAYLGPDILSTGSRSYDYVSWWLADRDRPDGSLDLQQTLDWRRLWHLLVSAMLEGPLSWLGLVELRYADTPDAAPTEPELGRAEVEDADIVRQFQPSTSRVVGFRPLPAAGVLVGRAVQVPRRQKGALPVLVALDATQGTPIVTVPPGGADEQLLTALAASGELDTAVDEGLRFRLSADRLQLSFDGGLDGGDLIAFLAERAGGVIPNDARELLEGWWRGYGTVRLYDEVAFVELSDDVLLRELRATTSLGRRYLEQLSPRVVAVDPVDVDEVLADLGRAGYTPRLIEEG